VSVVADPLVGQLSKFGLTQFRKGQREVIDAVLRGDDCLCIMPTGGGKSLCYQLPSLIRRGTTLVVSPLIALMKDQVDALQRLDIRATYINSSLDAATQRQRIEAFANSQYDLVYVAPERLRSVSFLDAVRQSHVQLMAIDEAHCISQWGHDFRPDYARIGRFRKRIGNPQTIALTATATVTVRQDIVSVLDLSNPSVFVSGFARDNLNLCVESPTSNSAKDERLVEYLKQTPGAGIIYATTRKGCEHLVEVLSGELDRSVAFYHAGMDNMRRRDIQEKFMNREIPIVVATNAFGMGIDRSDLRFVVHYNLPGSLEAYYQEAGRAGRDGLASQCLLLYSYQDRFIQEFFIENAYPSREIVKQVYQYLRSIQHDPIELTLQEIKEDLDISIGTEGIAVCENLLEKAGILERLDSHQNMASIKIDSDLPTLVDMVPRDAKSRRKVLRALEKIADSMRGERVYFHPARLAAATDMKWEAVARAIRELNKLDALDYVPPFRGRAVHMIRRDLQFEQINIDFEELQRRKAAEYTRLERVIDFVHTRQCRQLVILEYFGDRERKTCGRCDTCDPSQSTFRVHADASVPLQSSAAVSPETKDDTGAESDLGSLYVIQVALSGAARAAGRVGKTLLAQMLAGSTSKKVKQSGLQSLSTFGKLDRLKQTTVTELLDALIRFRLLQQSEKQRFRPVITITDYGREVMMGSAAFSVRHVLNSEMIKELNLQFRDCIPIEATAQSTDSMTTTSTPSPAPVQANDEPFDSSDFEAPADLFDVVRADDYEDAEPSRMQETSAGQMTSTQQPAPTIPFSKAEPATERPSYYWTWKLFDLGCSFFEVKQMRRLDDATIHAHLIQADNNDLDVPQEWIQSRQ
jgi:ATP-dependent DNA helicase RecQ